MLVLTRQAGQEICIGPDIRIRVVSVSGGQVRLGIEAPPSVTIYRAELLQAIQEQNRAAGALGPEEAAGILRRAAIVTAPADPAAA